MTRVTSHLLLAALLLASLSGCSLRRPVAQHAVAYNRAVERAHNQTVLLNVVRSMKRHPQHYTAITEVRGTATSSLTPSLSLTLKSGEGTPWEPSGSATRSDQALVTVSVLDDQEFVQGLLSPISLDQLDFFLSQGWPERLVGMLFVRQIDILNDDFDDPYCGEGARDKEGAMVTYKNAPDESDREDPFRYVKCFGARLLHLRDEERLKIEDRITKSVDFELETTRQDELAQLVLKANQAGLSIEKKAPAAGAGAESEPDSGAVPITYRLFKAKKTKVLKWGEEDNRTEVYVNEPAQIEKFEQARKDKGDEDKTAGPVLVYFRSAQSVVYYLGEIMRAQAVKGFSTETSFDDLEPKIVSDGEAAVLFAAWKRGRRDKAPVVAVEYGGETYVIPRFANCDTGEVGGCHRSMQTLAIVKQLIGLNKKRESLSTTGVVTAIGG